MQRPDYFDEVQAESRRLWNLLDENPQLKGAWDLLFQQVKSPSHVLSELLQNADDANASSAKAWVDGDRFFFEHNGTDFNADQFASICRFAFSSKRTVHTIGFRGIGFKSTFSLGPKVELTTPTLRVSFAEEAFTLPVWEDHLDASEEGCTRISIQLRDEHSRSAILASFDRWQQHPGALLFFRHIQRMDIDGDVSSKEINGPGPVSGSFRIHLRADTFDDVLLLRDKRARFPAAALKEIAEERNLPDSDEIPPCAVDVILGLEGSQRIYVVLPTGKTLNLPFSINAPFIQDPGRFGIKDPAISPTNRWLLRRAGMMIGQNMLDWLGNELIDIEERAEAYRLLPALRRASGAADELVLEGIQLGMADRPMLLCHSGEVLNQNQCMELPLVFSAVWDESYLSERFAKGKSVLSRFVNTKQRTNLNSWGILPELDEYRCINKLGDFSPRQPETYDQISILWRYISEAFYSYRLVIENLNIIPVQGKETLASAKSVVRVRGQVRMEENVWDFLKPHIDAVEHDFSEWMDSIEGWKDVHEELTFNTSADHQQIVEAAAQNFFNSDCQDDTQLLKFAWLLAALNMKCPGTWKFVASDGTNEQAWSGCVYFPPTLSSDLCPPEWTSDGRLLDHSYDNPCEFCSADQWRSWAQSGKSGLISFPPIEEKLEHFSSREKFEEEVIARGGLRPEKYNYKQTHIALYDETLPEELIRHVKRNGQRPGAWADLLEAILAANDDYYQDLVYVPASEISNQGTRRRLECGAVKADWIIKLAEQACLRDQAGEIAHPSDLLLRTPETEPFQTMERFVAANLDTERNRPILKALGCRTDAVAPDRLIERLKALSKADQPLELLHEIGKIYDTLDRLSFRWDTEQLKAVSGEFQGSELIISRSGDFYNSLEIFIDEAMEGFPAVHQQFCKMAFWERVGVKRSPSRDTLIAWVESLEPGRKLSDKDVRLLRKVLTEYGADVLARTKCWLTIGNTLEQSELLRYRMHSSRILVTRLFSQVRAQVADCRMVEPDHLPRELFGLPVFSSVVHYELNGVHGVTLPSWDWIKVLGELLSRIRNDEEIFPWKQDGDRLARTEVEYLKSIIRRPMIDGEAVGDEETVSCCWINDRLLVSSRDLVHAIEPLVEELGLVFSDTALRKTIRTCAGRDRAFIATYLGEQFDLTPMATAGSVPVTTPEMKPTEEKSEFDKEPSVTGENTDSSDTPGSEPESPVPSDPEPKLRPEEDAEEPPLPPNPVPIPSEKSKPRVDVMREWAESQDFQWNENRKHFFSGGGEIIRKAEGSSIFPWEWIDIKGIVKVRVYPLSQNLHEGVVMSGEMYEMFKLDPRRCLLVLRLDQDTFQTLDGKAILSMRDQGKLDVSPVRYLIKEN